MEKMKKTEKQAERSDIEIMTYRIEYAGGKCCNTANNRIDLLEWLKLLKDETITDIRKLYKSGVSDSVMEHYEKYIKKGGDGGG